MNPVTYGITIQNIDFDILGMLPTYDDLFATVKGAWGVRQLVSSYSGPLIRVYDTSAEVSRDLYAGADGFLDVDFFCGDLLVERIYNQAGSGDYLESAATGSTPTLRMYSAPNGQHSIRYDGDDDQSTDNSAASTALDYMVANPVMLVIANGAGGESGGVVATIPHADGSNASPSHRLAITVSGTSITDSVLFLNGATTGFTTTEGTFAEGWASIAALVKQGYLVESANGSMTNVAISTSDITYPNNSRLRLGGSGANTANWGGHFYEAGIAADSSVTPGDTRDYLATIRDGYLDNSLTKVASQAFTNPGFETGDATGWTNLVGSSSPLVTSGFAHSGTYKAAGGNSASNWSAQTLAVPSGIESQIDAGLISVVYGTYMAGFSDNDSGRVFIDCFDGSSNWLATRMSNFEDPTGTYLWAQYRYKSRLPAGTRFVRFNFQTARASGTENSAYIDDVFDLEFLLEPIPMLTLYSQSGVDFSDWTNVVGTMVSASNRGPFGYDASTWVSNAAGQAYRDCAIDSGIYSAIAAGLASVDFRFSLGRFETQNDPGRFWLESRDSSANVLQVWQNASTRQNYHERFIGFVMGGKLHPDTQSFRINVDAQRISAGSNLDFYVSQIFLGLIAPGVI